jgi:hypothetical protein
MACQAKDLDSAKAYTRQSDKWDNGDFEVITADGVRFLVPSYILFFARYATSETS